MAEPGDVLPRAAGIELLLQTEPELARALERSYPPSSEGMAVTPFDDDDEYMLAAELRFTLTSLHLQALCTLRTLAVGGNRRPIYADRYGEGKDSACSPTETAQRVRALREMRDKHAAAMEERLGATSKVPRVVAVADAYGLSQVEASVRELLVLQPSVPKCCNPQCPSAATPMWCQCCSPSRPGCNSTCPGCNPMCSQVLELLVLQRSHRTALFASCLQAVDEGYDAHAVVPTLSGASSLQLAAFFEEERLHVKEGVVVIDEDYSSRKTASISTEARDALSLSLSLRPSPSLPLSPSRSRSRSLAPTLPPNQACDAIVHGLLPRLDSCRMMTSACRMMTSMTSCTPGGDAGSGGAGGAGGGGGGAARQGKRAKAARAKLEKLRLKLSGTTLLQVRVGVGVGVA
jgi:hypothetical protein